MARAIALLDKELRAHFWSALASTLCLALLIGVQVLAERSRQRSTSVIDACVRFLLVVLPLAAALIGDRLVATEFRNKTHQFLKSLPVEPWQLFAFKYLLGLLFTCGAALASLSVVVTLARREEPVGAHFLLILLLRTFLWSWFIWSMGFLIGLLGHMRIPLALCTFLSLVIIVGATDLEPMRLGPLRLVDPTNFSYERTVIPWTPLAWAAGLSLLAMGSALLLLSLKDAALVEEMARPMTPGRKIRVTLVLFCYLIAAGDLLERAKKPIYRYTGEDALRSRLIALTVAPKGDTLAAPALFEALEAGLKDLQALMGWKTLPAVTVTRTAGLDPRVRDKLKLTLEDGLVAVTGSGPPEDPNMVDFRTYVFQQILDLQLYSVASFEPNRWYLDGFSHWWATRARTAGHLDQVRWTRALWATARTPLDHRQLVEWNTYRETHGSLVAESVAYSGLVVLERLRSPQAVLALAKALYGREVSRGITEVFYLRSHPFPQVFAATTGIDLGEFLNTWNQQLRESAAKSGPLEVDLTGEIRVDPASNGLTTVRCQVRGTFAQQTMVTLVHRSLGATNVELPESEMHREALIVPAGAATIQVEFPGLYGHGQRAFLALDVDSRPLRCSLRIARLRSDIP
jgi:ABC-type transport system involved in multi-copper enzyme maturation permease subunit